MSTNITKQADEIFPFIDATQQNCITNEQAQFFRDNGLLIIRNVLRGEELQSLREQTSKLVELAMTTDDAPDTAYSAHEISGERVPHRVEYVIDKTVAGKALLGHPFILKSVELLQGRNFVPTWDSMVFKREGAGVAVPWHRDGGTNGMEDALAGRPIFNVDFYLDHSDITNCLWGIPGSNRWTPQEAGAKCRTLNTDGFQTEGAIPILMNPGDVIFHNVLALHGSPPAQSKLRRVLYYEFRPGEVEREVGPHTLEYIPLKQKVLLACLRQRAQTPAAADEERFEYRPDEEFAPPPLGADEELETYRYPHEKFWRDGTRG